MIAYQIEPDLRCEKEVNVNEHIGRRLRRRRLLLGMTQMGLGEATGLQFQQIQKYECGATRIAAARLYTLAQALRAPVEYFFQGAPTLDGQPPNEATSTPPLFESRDAMELMESYAKLPERVRNKLRDFAKVLSEASEAAPALHEG